MRRTVANEGPVAVRSLTPRRRRRVTEACVYLDLFVGQQPDLDRAARMIRAVIN